MVEKKIVLIYCSFEHILCFSHNVFNQVSNIYVGFEAGCLFYFCFPVIAVARLYGLSGFLCLIVMLEGMGPGSARLTC